MNWIYTMMIRFLENLEIDKAVISLIDKEAEELIEQFPNAITHPITEDEIIYKLLCEKYNLNAPNVKAISETLNKEYKFGRNSKTALKKYLDYEKEEYLVRFINSLVLDNEVSIDREYIENILLFCEPVSKKQIEEKFLQLWNEAREVEDEQKLKDYLLGIYSKIFSMGLENLRLIEIYQSNEALMRKVFNEESLEQLQAYCLANDESLPSELATKKFNDKYLELMKKEYQAQANALQLEPHLNQYYIDEGIQEQTTIKDRGSDIKLLPTEDYEMVHYTVNQDLYEKFQNKDKFLDHVLSTIKEIYRVLANEKVFTLKIENIYDVDGCNLKWELYSKLTIYAEHFISYEEKSMFYKAHEIALDMLSRYEFRLLEDDSNKNREKKLKAYFSGKIGEEELFSSVQTSMDREKLFELLDGLKYVHYGFSFNDCIVLERIGTEFQNGELTDIVQNTTEVLLVFYKFRADQRRIPCPSCGSIHISGNSYPELNNRSWECKSPYCKDRSKSNRGKRYSKRSNYMQWGAVIPSSHDIISRDLIAKWRRDIAKVYEEQDIFEMIIKYFSFTHEKLLFVNTNDLPLHIANQENRQAVVLSPEISGFESTVVIDRGLEGEIAFYENGLYMKKFTEFFPKESEDRVLPEISEFLQLEGRLKLIQGHSNEVLKGIEGNRLTAAVTSPPYYNARDYSQWPNLYLYFFDMYNIMRQSLRTLKPGAIFLYNIADIADNENTVVKSKMGEKRVPLGAYTIYFFQKAGFELLDNILWDKGEPQSNRQKNDGKFTPHYQKPLNAYEHMFMFKKPGAPLILNEGWENKRGKWTTNIVPFQPVIKINSKGENILGHTAPFPEDIPRFVTNVFTQSEEDIVFDPFSGSMTSALVAYQNGRVGLGMELLSEYVEVSRARAEATGANVEILNMN